MSKRIFFQKLKIIDSKCISIVSVILFIVTAAIIFISNRYMNNCLQREADMQQDRIELHNLGEKLAEASDYLTDEARKFAVTGEIEHLHNYWYEVNEVRTRDDVISEISSYNLPENEQALLTGAKSYSDELIKTETLSMKLTLLSDNFNLKSSGFSSEIDTYLNYLNEYNIPEEYYLLSAEEMNGKAIEILYDSYYYESKNLIMSPIDEFQEAMDKRLDNSVEKAINGNNVASFIQNCCSVFVIALTGLFLSGLNILYVLPLNRYTNALSKYNTKKQQDFSKLRVNPQGSRELYDFGRSFNHLSLILHKELKRRRIAEEEMRLARDEANDANKAKSDFLAQMSHELRTPLNAIIGYMHLLKKTSLNEKQHKYCNAIDFSSENLLELINNILDFSKIESGNMTFEIMDFNLPKLLNDVYDMMKSNAIEKNLKLEINLSEDLPEFVKGDSLKLRQVLINLLSNAVKFTSDGNIILTADLKSIDNEKIIIEFGVRDTGIGISQEDTEKIFEPFVQSDAGVTRKYGGTGLGLPISQKIVKAISNGDYKIEVESVLNSGSYFHFKMGFLSGNRLELNQISNEPEAFGNDKKILLVDDNEINLEMEKLILSDYGLTVFTADSGKNAISISGQNFFDMIFLDLHMPELDGYETAREIRLMEKYKDIPIIALTADAESKVRERVIKSGMNDCLYKPFQPEKLRKLISDYFKIEMESEKSDDGDIIFDYNKCLRNLNGRKEVLQKLINHFLEFHKSDCESIVKNAKAGHFDDASKILHDIKGISGNLCCEKLYNISCILKSELEKNCSDKLDLFQQIWNETIKAFQEHSESCNPETDKRTDMPFIEIWKKFIYLCREYDISATDCFEKNRNAFKTAFEKSDFIELEREVRKYNFTWIIENIKYQE